MRSTGKLTTQKDVARLAGVSQAVVSVVLGGNSGNIGVSQEVSERVMSAAKRLNYRPNLSARSMRQGRFFNIGYFAATDNCGEVDFAAYRAGVYDAASEQDFHVMMIRLPSSSAKDPEAVPKIFRESHLDAMVINPLSVSISDIKEVVGPSNTLPIVYLNAKESHNSVYVDDNLGARLATEHLYNQGMRRIAFFRSQTGGNSEHYSKTDRIEGYTSFMAEHGLVAQVKKLDADIYEPAGPTSEELVSRSAILDWVRGPSSPEAVFCYCDSDAMAFQQILYEANIRVPDDISVIGYNDDEMCVLSASPLSSIHIPRYEMAVAAVNMAIAMINNSTQSDAYRAPSIKFNPKLVVRKSTLPSLASAEATGVENLGAAGHEA